MKYSKSPAWMPSAGFLLFPGRCLLCQRHTKRDLDLCYACESVLPVLETSCTRCALPMAHAGICGICQRKLPSFTTVIAPYRYQFPVDRMVRAFKYSGKFKYSRVMSTLLAEHLLSTLPGLESHNSQGLASPDVILPVPLHWRRHMRRGFNQAEVIARELSHLLDIPVNTRLLSRIRHTPAQEALSRRERQGNLKNAFSVVKSVKGLSLALVDDVLTTGSTADAAAHCLMRAGAKQVQIWAIARTPLEK